MTAADSETIPVREGEEIDARAVEKWLRERLEDLPSPMRVEQFPGGHANLTYLLRFGDGPGARELVLRRPPLGPVAPHSHDMGREYRVLSRLADHYPQAPHVYGFCDDLSVIGAIFVVMERRRGVIIRTEVPPEIDAHPDGRMRASLALIDAMAAFHDVDYAAIGLADLGRPEGFVERQVRGWKDRWERAKNTEIELFDRMYDWLVEHLPRSPGASLVHNDLKFDNAMLDPADPDHVVALLDWDMTTLGDPLVDLGTLLGYWAEPGDPPERGATNAVTAQPGFATRAQLKARYAERRGIEVSGLDWYEAFAHWKTAVVLQQIYIRYVRGQTRDERFAQMGHGIPVLIGMAAQVAGLEG
ncbi:MAG: phosphotransferase family protein [Myxococcota bacterium]